MKGITIKGMSCEHCTNAVKDALEELGLNDVSVDLESGTASFDEAAIAENSLRAAIDDAGFEVTEIR